jgi:cold shock CspA family protein
MKMPPSPETVRFIAKVLAARKTGMEELPLLIATLHDAFEQAPAPVAAPAPEEAPLAFEAEPRPARRRGRPPRDRLLPLYQETIPAPPPAPRLIRRAEIAPAAKPAEALPPRPTTRAALRGLVKWYDPRSRTGAVRLPGYAADVAVGADALDRAGIPRLFKGQEIEASVTESDGQVHLVTLSLPGRPETDAAGGGPLGAARRHAKPVVIEMKRDAMRRVAARVEAEQLLGPPRPPSGGHD